MENLVIQGSEKTPHFTLQANGDINFGGISMPEDSADFYFKILDWISDYYREPAEETVLTVSFRYLNSSSSSMIFKIFQFFNKLQSSGKSKVKCSWYFEQSDQNMQDYIKYVQEYADEIDFTVYPTDHILEHQAS